MQSFCKTGKSMKTAIINSFAIATITVSLMHATTVMADTASKNSEQQLAQTSSEYNSKVGIKQEPMTSKNKKARSDGRIGAFSMADGAREGFYGDGEFAD